jgi:hypothetical protein
MRGVLRPGITLLHGLHGAPETLTTYIFDVTMAVQFDKMTAANWRTAHYKRWASWLMSELPGRINQLNIS